MPDPAVRAFIAVGSNIDPHANILLAIEQLARSVPMVGVSTFYRTTPLGRPGQPAFLNGVVVVETAMAPRDLKFGLLRRIEADLGRVRTADKYAARTIDLDILLYGDRIIDQPDLKVPDPDLRERAFLIVPLAELAPDVVLPDDGRAAAEAARGVDGAGLVADIEFSERLRRRVGL